MKGLVRNICFYIYWYRLAIIWHFFWKKLIPIEWYQDFLKENIFNQYFELENMCFCIWLGLTFWIIFLIKFNTKFIKRIYYLSMYWYNSIILQFLKKSYFSNLMFKMISLNFVENKKIDIIMLLNAKFSKANLTLLDDFFALSLRIL